MKSLSLIDYILCAVLSMMFSASPYYLETGTVSLDIGFFLSVIVLFVAFIIATSLIRNLLDREIDLLDSESNIGEYIRVFMNHPHHLIRTAILIMVCWMPILLFLYPGTFINDTWGQLQSFIQFFSGTGNLSDHHPIFDTLIMGAVIVPLSQITGKWHLMIFAWVLLISFCTALAFSYTIDYSFHQLKVGPRITVFLFLAYCFLPIFPTSVQTVSKDAIFSVFFVLFAVKMMEVVRTSAFVLYDGQFLITLIMISLGCCLTKKVGMYVVLLSMIVALIVFRRSTLRLMIPIICAFFLMFAVMPAVMTVLNVYPGGKQEMFSLPFQMTARYTIEHGDDITDEEYEVLSKVLNMETICEDYVPDNADPVKGYSQRSEDRYYISYIFVWLKQGVRHPISYIHATNCMLSGWFSWLEYAPLMNMDWRNQHNTEIIPEWVPIRGFSANSALSYERFFHLLYQNPFFKLVLSYGFYAGLIPAFSLGTVLNKKKINGKFWVALLPIILSLVLGCWLAPVSYHIEGRRYLYPLTYTAPLMLAWSFYTSHQKNNEV